MSGPSLRRKLILVSMCTTTAALLLACVLFLELRLRRLPGLRSRVARDAGDHGRHGDGGGRELRRRGDGAGGARRPGRATSTSGGARLHANAAPCLPSIAATARRRGAPGRSRLHRRPLGPHISWWTLDVVQPITLAGERIGTIALHASRDAQYARMKRFGVIAAGDHPHLVAGRVPDHVATRATGVRSGRAPGRSRQDASRATATTASGCCGPAMTRSAISSTSFNDMLVQIQRQDARPASSPRDARGAGRGADGGTERDQRGPGPIARSRRACQPRQERVPRQHESRDPHADERRDRDDRPHARLAAAARAARTARDRQHVRRGAADASSTTSSTCPRSRPAASISTRRRSCCRRRSRMRSARRASAPEPRASSLEWHVDAADTPRIRGDRGPAAPGADQPREQRRQVHGARAASTSASGWTPAAAERPCCTAPSATPASASRSTSRR